MIRIGHDILMEIESFSRIAPVVVLFCIQTTATTAKSKCNCMKMMMAVGLKFQFQYTQFNLNVLLSHLCVVYMCIFLVLEEVDESSKYMFDRAIQTRVYR